MVLGWFPGDSIDRREQFPSPLGLECVTLLRQRNNLRQNARYIRVSLLQLLDGFVRNREEIAPDTFCALRSPATFIVLLLFTVSAPIVGWP